MKILVIDDSKIHQDSARELLQGHELTVVGTYDEGHKLITGAESWENKRPGHRFDVVLVDLLMPASRMTMGREGSEFVGQEMPVGVFLALLAAKYGAKYVGLLTDTNHHDHPAAACLDAFNKRESEPTPFMVGGTKVILTNNGSWTDGQPKQWGQLLEYLLSS